MGTFFSSLLKVPFKPLNFLLATSPEKYFSTHTVQISPPHNSHKRKTLIRPIIKVYTLNFFRFMATGNFFHSLGYNFRMGTSTVPSIVKQVSKSIWTNVHMPALGRKVCLDAVQELYDRWNFPNCFGCIDGKHIRIKCSSKSLSFSKLLQMQNVGS